MRWRVCKALRITRTYPTLIKCQHNAKVFRALRLVSINLWLSCLNKIMSNYLSVRDQNKKRDPEMLLKVNIC